MVGQLRTLLARTELSPRTPRRKQWSAAHNLRASLCMEGFCFMGGRGLYFLTAVDNFCERSWGNFGTQDFNHFTCLQMFCLLTGRIASLPVLEDSLIEQRCFLASLFSSSLMSICLEKAESGVIGWQQRFITVCYFPRVPIKILIVPLRRASPLQSICEQCIK